MREIKKIRETEKRAEHRINNNGNHRLLLDGFGGCVNEESRIIIDSTRACKTMKFG